MFRFRFCQVCGLDMGEQTGTIPVCENPRCVAAHQAATQSRLSAESLTHRNGASNPEARVAQNEAYRLVLETYHYDYKSGERITARDGALIEATEKVARDAQGRVVA